MAQLPAAKRIIAKWAMFKDDGTSDTPVDYQKGLDGLLQAKALATEDRRIEAYLLDDFSTATVAGGVQPQHLADLQFENFSRPPPLPLMATVYEMSLEDDRLPPPLLPYFAGYLNPLWHAANIEKQKGYTDRLA